MTGGAEYNRPGGQGGAGGGMPQGESTLMFRTDPHSTKLTSSFLVDENGAIAAANAHAGNGDENASLFSNALSHVGGMNQNDANVDEEAVQQQHAQAYGQGQAGSMDAQGMGG